MFKNRKKKSDLNIWMRPLSPHLCFASLSPPRFYITFSYAPLEGIGSEIRVNKCTKIEANIWKVYYIHFYKWDYLSRIVLKKFMQFSIKMQCRGTAEANTLSPNGRPKCNALHFCYPGKSAD